MPDRDVKTIRDLIYYQYAKIIARRAFSMPDGKEAKKQHYGFIKKTFLELKNGTKKRGWIGWLLFMILLIYPFQR